MGEHGFPRLYEMEELGHQNWTSDSLSSALSNGENPISSFLSYFNLWLGPVWCMHAQTMREMSKNGVIFDGVESNGGVRESKLNSFLVFKCSIE